MTEMEKTIKEFDELRYKINQKIENIKEELWVDLRYLFSDIQKERELATKIEEKIRQMVERYNYGNCPFCGSSSIYSDNDSSRNPYMKDNYCNDCDARFPVRMMAAIFMDEISKIFGVK